MVAPSGSCSCEVLGSVRSRPQSKVENDLSAEAAPSTHCGTAKCGWSQSLSVETPPLTLPTITRIFHSFQTWLFLQLAGKHMSSTHRMALRPKSEGKYRGVVLSRPLRENISPGDKMGLSISGWGSGGEFC